MRTIIAFGRVSTGAVALAAVTTVTPALAQPTLDQVLSNAEAQSGDHCSVVSVNFNFPVRYVSHFPTASGEDLRIRVRAVEREDGTSLARRESTRAPETSVGEIEEIQFDGEGQNEATLTFQFSAPAQFKVGQGQDFRSIRVALSDGVEAQACTPEAHPAHVEAPVTLNRGAAVVRPAADVVGADVGAGDPLLAEARAAMTIGDNAHAVQLLTRVLRDPASPSARDALELLGVVRERAGQAAHARAEYEEYLRRYPSGESSERVRQRLAALLAAEAPQQAELRAPERQRRGGGTRWRANASFSQFYFRDDATYSYEQTFGATPTTTEETQTNQNELLTALDFDVGVTAGAVETRVRVSGAYTNDFRDDGEDEGSLSAAYLEVGDTEDRVVARIGRQTKTTSGVFGRFDGANASVRAGKVRFGVTAGYPVESSRDLTFDPDRYFYAANVDYHGEKFAASIYRIQQTSDELTDRDAAGMEVRYISGKANLFTLIDYDVHYKELNIGLVNSTLALGEATTLNVGYDYRRAPMLATINALVGQGVGSLEELKLTYSEPEIEQLALDRSAESTTYYAGIAHEFSERLSVNIDATVSDLGATPASGGVEATEATGQELYASAQLVATGLLKDGDLGIVGVRYADTATSIRYGLDFSTRYPITQAVRINPRLRITDRQNKNDDGTQLSVRPSFRLNVRAGRRVSFETELGADWMQTDSAAMREESWDYFATVGYRLDF